MTSARVWNESSESRCRRMEGVLQAVAKELENDALRVERLLDHKLAEVFRAHSYMLAGIGHEIEKLLRRESMDVILATRQVIERYEKKFREKDDVVFRDKADDVLDLGGRLLSALSGHAAPQQAPVPPGSVLVAKCLYASDTVSLKEWDVAGVVMEGGSASGHAALLTREAGIPMIGRVENLVGSVNDGDLLLIDGSQGEVTVHPGREHHATHRRKSHHDRKAREEARRDCVLPAITPCGRWISVGANIGRLDDAEAAIENGADEIGLFRTECLELRRQRRPSPRELLKELRSTLQFSRSFACVVRLPDLGGDKPVSYLDFSNEPNPALGRRGIRLLLSEPDLLDGYLDALAELSREQELRILVPMVTDASEMAEVRRRLERACLRKSVNPPPALGAMIETPAAALSVREIAPLVDFLSIGTNDLTQYTCVADRENALVADYFNDHHPTVYRLIRMVCEDSGEVPVSVCGELAGHGSEVAKLLACGVNSLSVAPTAVPAVKALVRRANCRPVACDRREDFVRARFGSRGLAK